MLNFIKRLFGEGNIYLNLTTSSGEKIRAKVPYVGSIDTLNREELYQTVRNEAWLKYGVRLVKIEIEGIS